MTIDEFKKAWYNDSDFIVCHTSGSTGIPKEIKLPKSDMTLSASATNAFFDLKADARYVCPISLEYIGGKMMAVRSFVGGGSIDVIVPSNDFTIDGVADLLAVVPSQVPNVIRKYGPTEVRHLIIGGAPMTNEMRAALYRTGIDSWITYGMTETASHVALARVNDDATPVFEALPGIKFSTDKRGCLIINRPGYTLGTIITNDIVELKSATSFCWLGRADNVINSGGIKIIPEKLEQQIIEIFPELGEHILVRARHDEKWGTVPELVIEGNFDESLLLSKIREVVGSRQCPKTVVKVAQLDRTPNGKIKR